MALNKLKFNSLNVTPTAGKTIGFNSSANGLEATLSGGSMTFIKKLTASSSSTLSFVDGSSDVVLDNTYKEYIFTFNNMHPGTDAVKLTFNLSIDSGSNYNVTKTATNFYAGHTEADATGFGYDSGLAQSTANAFITVGDIGSAADESTSGYLHLFNPSSTTFVKHFISAATIYGSNPQSQITYGAGYGNTTSAIDAVQFKMNSGNIDSGTITLYGIN
jgi:hypothetical protein